jgi:FkbM family methyltransferase
MIFTKARKSLRVLSAISQGYRNRVQFSPPTYVDIGARGGLSRAWKAVNYCGLARALFFEPDPVAAADIRRKNPKSIVAPYALGSTDNQPAALYITRDAGRSSVLRPNPAGAGVKDESAWQVVKSSEIVLHRLDTVWRKEWGRPDYVKIDVQGFELEVLKGIGDLLREVKCVQVESSLVPFYEGQPAFGTLNEFLRANDFVLVKLKPTGLYDMEIIEFDCFYIRSDSHSSAEVILWKRINDVGDHNRIVTWGY